MYISSKLMLKRRINTNIHQQQQQYQNIDSFKKKTKNTPNKFYTYIHLKYKIRSKNNYNCSE